MVLMAEHTTRLTGRAIVTSRLWSECHNYWLRCASSVLDLMWQAVEQGTLFGAEFLL